MSHISFTRRASARRRRSPRRRPGVRAARLRGRVCAAGAPTRVFVLQPLQVRDAKRLPCPAFFTSATNVVRVQCGHAPAASASASRRRTRLRSQSSTAARPACCSPVSSISRPTAASTRGALVVGRFGDGKFLHQVNATGDNASSFMCGRYRQLCHHISGEFRTASRYRSSRGQE